MSVSDLRIPIRFFSNSRTRNTIREKHSVYLSFEEWRRDIRVMSDSATAWTVCQITDVIHAVLRVLQVILI